MTYRFRIASRAVAQGLLLSALAGGLIVAPPDARADDKDAPAAYDKSDHGQGWHDIVEGQHVEGHIAFLHAELGITAAEEPLWATVAEAMREDVRNIAEAETRVSQQNPDAETAIQYLQNRAVFARLRAEGEERFLNALRPLYDKFSPQQKAMADDLLIQHKPE